LKNNSRIALATSDDQTQFMENTSRILDTIRDAWSWTGVQPAEVVVVNSFGNIIARATDGTYWRVCPEALSCNVIARSPSEYESLWRNEEFQNDWQMQLLLEIAQHKLGPLPKGQCYCLKIPAAVGGKYTQDNIGSISVEELISFSGDLARQIKDLPDGTPVQINFFD
jgi:hypothetical protein